MTGWGRGEFCEIRLASPRSLDPSAHPHRRSNPVQIGSEIAPEQPRDNIPPGLPVGKLDVFAYIARMPIPRSSDQLRDIRVTRAFAATPAGPVIWWRTDTIVRCAASVLADLAHQLKLASSVG